MFLDECDERFTDENKYTFYPLIRDTILNKMKKDFSERFFELLLMFEADNQRYFINHLGCTLRNDSTQSLWIIYDYEDDSQYEVSLEILDLIEGFICTVEIDEEEIIDSNKRGFWRMRVI